MKQKTILWTAIVAAFFICISTTYASVGDIYYGSTTYPYTTALPIGTNGNCLTSNGSIPGWSSSCGSGGGSASAALPYGGIQYSIMSGTSTILAASSSLTFSTTTGNLTAPFFTATSTTATSSFPNINSTNVTLTTLGNLTSNLYDQLFRSSYQSSVFSSYSNSTSFGLPQKPSDTASTTGPANSQALIAVGNYIFYGGYGTGLEKVNDDTMQIATSSTASSCEWTKLVYDNNNNQVYGLCNIGSAVSVDQIDQNTLATTQVIASVGTESNVSSMTTDGTYLYVGIDNTPSAIYKYAISNFSLVASTTLGSYNQISDLEYDGVNIYATGYANWVAQVNPSTLVYTATSTNTAAPNCANSNEMAVAPDYIYVACEGSNYFLQIQKSNLNNQIGTPTLSESYGAYYDGTFVWFGSKSAIFNDDLQYAMYRFNPLTNEMVIIPIPSAGAANKFVNDGERLFFLSWMDGALWRTDTSAFIGGNVYENIQSLNINGVMGTSATTAPTSFNFVGGTGATLPFNNGYTGGGSAMIGGKGGDSNGTFIGGATNGGNGGSLFFDGGIGGAGYGGGTNGATGTIDFQTTEKGPTVFGGTLSVSGVTTLAPSLNGLLWGTNGTVSAVSTSSLGLLGSSSLPWSVPNGGTGSTSYATNALILGSSTNPLSQLLVGASGTVLQIVNGTPTYVATSSLGITGGGGSASAAQPFGGIQYSILSGASTILAASSSLLFSTTTGQVSLPFIVATSSATSTFAGGINIYGQQSLFGISALTDQSEYQAAKVIISNGSIPNALGHTLTSTTGIIGEGAGSLNQNGVGFYGIGTTNGSGNGYGTVGVSTTTSSSDSGTAYGGDFLSEPQHTGGQNIGALGVALNSTYSSNIGIEGLGGNSSTTQGVGVEGMGLPENNLYTTGVVGVLGSTTESNPNGQNIAVAAYASLGLSNYSFYGYSGDIYENGNAVITKNATTSLIFATSSNFINATTTTLSSVNLAATNATTTNLSAAYASTTVLNIPTTVSATVGVIDQNGTPLLQTYGSSNLFIGTPGFAAGNFTMTGSNNMCFGRDACSSITSATGNVGIGGNALISDQTGINNVGLGASTLYNVVSGQYNVAIGASDISSADVSNDTAIGEGTFVNVTGNDDTGIGYRVSQNLTSGADDTIVGDDSGSYPGGTGANSITTGSNDTFLGYRSGFSTSTQFTNAMALGYESVVGCSSCAVLGGTGANAVNVGIGTTTPATALDVNGDITDEKAASHYGTGANTAIVCYMQNGKLGYITITNLLASGNCTAN